MKGRTMKQPQFIEEHIVRAIREAEVGGVGLKKGGSASLCMTENHTKQHLAATAHMVKNLPGLLSKLD